MITKFSSDIIFLYLSEIQLFVITSYVIAMLYCWFSVVLVCDRTSISYC